MASVSNLTTASLFIIIIIIIIIYHDLAYFESIYFRNFINKYLHESSTMIGCF